MAIIVVGGQTRNIGKTSVVAGLIAALPQFEWTAFKITQFGHGICSANGKPCACETGAHTVAISQERDPTTVTDSARFLAAGAVRSFWVRTQQGQLADAMPRIQKEISLAKNVILESNSIVNFLAPDLYITVLDPTNRDFKTSALRHLEKADAIVWSNHAPNANNEWPQAAKEIARNKPQFYIEPPTYASTALVQFVTKRPALEYLPRHIKSSP